MDEENEEVVRSETRPRPVCPEELKGDDAGRRPGNVYALSGPYQTVMNWG